VLTRGKKKCPALSTTDRLVMGLCTLVMTPRRIGKSAIAIAVSTLLDFHRALVTIKYSRFFSKKAASKPGPIGPCKELVKLVVETKEKNTRYGCPRMALLVGRLLGEAIDAETVRRILTKHYRLIPGKGPSWLLPIGNSQNKLCSIDLLRLDSVILGHGGNGSIH